MPGYLSASNIFKPIMTRVVTGGINPDVLPLTDNRTATFYDLGVYDGGLYSIAYNVSDFLEADYFALAGLNFTGTAEMRLEYLDTDAITWLIAIDWQSVADKKIAFFTFPKQQAYRWRISFRNVLNVGGGLSLVHVGLSHELPRVSAPHTFLNLVRAKNKRLGASRYAFAGKKSKRRARNYNLQIPNFSIEEMDQLLNSAEAFLQKSPFFYQFDSANNPDAVALLVADGQIKQPNYDSIIRTSININTKVLI